MPCANARDPREAVPVVVCSQTVCCRCVKECLSSMLRELHMPRCSTCRHRPKKWQVVAISIGCVARLEQGTGFSCSTKKCPCIMINVATRKFIHRQGPRCRLTPSGGARADLSGQVYDLLPTLVFHHVIPAPSFAKTRYIFTSSSHNM